MPRPRFRSDSAPSPEDHPRPPGAWLLLLPLALYVIADRLARPIGHWRPFDTSGARRRFLRTGVPRAVAI